MTRYTEEHREVHQLFVSHLYTCDLDDPFTELKDHKEDPSHVYPGEYWAAQQTNSEAKTENYNPDYRVLEKFPETKEKILTICRDYLRGYFGYTKNDFLMSTSWITITPPNVISTEHNHRGAFFSGVLYFDEYDEKSGRLVFVDPLTSLKPYNLESVYEMDRDKCWSYVITPAHGRLCLFPSYLRHKVEKNTSDVTRYSLAFNILPKGRWNVKDSDSMIDSAWFAE